MGNCGKNKLKGVTITLLESEFAEMSNGTKGVRVNRQCAGVISRDSNCKYKGQGFSRIKRLKVKRSQVCNVDGYDRMLKPIRGIV